MSTPIKARDQAAALALIDAMIGWTAVGVDSNGEAISSPTSPEVRAHLAAALGDACMSYGNDAKPGRREAMAAYLRSVASFLSDAADGLTHFDTPVSDAEVGVLVERRRQIGVEGWTAEHDDAYQSGTIAAAAAAYVTHASAVLKGIPVISMPASWPWSREWWKPSTPRRSLEKAGALIIAEMERIDRAEGAVQAERDDIRERVKADVEKAVSSGAGVQAECNKVLNEIAAERGVPPAEVLRDAISQMKAVHHG